MTIPTSFRAMVVRANDQGGATRAIEEMKLGDIGENEVVVKVKHSSLNYKDGLAATGHPGVALNLPHVPGIDAVGTVVQSQSDNVKVGNLVMVFDAKFGTAQFGGYSEYIRVPASWTYPLPDGITAADAMAYGTAGFTATQCVMALERQGVTPAAGEVLVTGATGGVGSFAVMLLASRGFDVVAVTGKSDRIAWLGQLGAKETISRQEATDTCDRPLLKARWAGVVDTVGGDILTTALRSTKIGGCVTACGLVASHELNMTVYPFILRGVQLVGIDSANISHETRTDVWHNISGEYKIDDIAQIAEHVSFDELDGKIEEILTGKIAGRIIVDIAND